MSLYLTRFIVNGTLNLELRRKVDSTPSVSGHSSRCPGKCEVLSQLSSLIRDPLKIVPTSRLREILLEVL